MKYLIMDARANDDEDSAMVFEVCDTRAEAEQNRKDYGDDCVIVESE